MDLNRYLDRIGFAGTPRPDLDTLRAVMLAQVLTVPFENLDVQLRRPLTTDVEGAYGKIVDRRRGGWCYEQNGLLGWALAEIGFDVTRAAGGVMRVRAGDGVLGNHLCLLVECGDRYLVDAGFGGSLTAPMPLAPGETSDPPYDIRLGREEDGYWRFTERLGSEPFSFDFRPHAADENLLQEKCNFLQTDPDSPFVRNLVAQRRRLMEHVILRGRVLTRLTAAGKTTHLIDSADELSEILAAEFRLFEPTIKDLWPAVVERHRALFPNESG